jgi:hypothetical protein
MRYTFALFLILITLPMWGQTAATGNASTKGTCSPAVSGNNNTVVIKCTIDKAQGNKMVEILNKILASQDQATIIAKLDQILADESRPVTTQTCLGSNCAGTNYGNQNVNYGVPAPAPNVVGLQTKQLAAEDISDKSVSAMNLEGELVKNPGVEMTFSIDSMFANPMFTIVCDRPCQSTESVVAGTSSPRMLKSSNPEITAVMVGSMTPLLAGTTLTIRVRSLDNNPISVLSVSGYIPPTH